MEFASAKKDSANVVVSPLILLLPICLRPPVDPSLWFVSNGSFQIAVGKDNTIVRNSWNRNTTFN